MRSGRLLCVGAGLCLVLTAPVSAQDLDPRAYVHVPVDGTFLMFGFGVSEGGIVTDPTLAVTDVQASVLTPSVGAGRSFGLLGRTAQLFGVVPFSWADVSGKVLGDQRAVRRDGLSDMRLRMSWLVRGAPAVTVAELAKAPRRTILGVSLNMAAPVGEYDREKLINLGTNRWAFRPEFAVSRPLGQRWLVDAYAGLWLFTANNESYPGTQTKTQAPMGSFQAHVSYNFQRQLWAALDLTYYVGGRTTVEGVRADDMQSNARGGLTVALPVGQRHSIKVAVSRGAIVRVGADFNTYSFAWQTAWAPRPAPAP
jgi:Putative MetA-pathway of phenol degradation